jgi:hypothetical protein
MTHELKRMTKEYDIEAKPVTFRDTTFRSTTEARWASVFHELGLVYEYERLSCVLSREVIYTPDFWLRQLSMYVEIKPEPKFCDWPVYKAFAVAENTPILVIAGNPEGRNYLASLINSRGTFSVHEARFADIDESGLTFYLIKRSLIDLSCELVKISDFRKTPPIRMWNAIDRGNAVISTITRQRTKLAKE